MLRHQLSASIIVAALIAGTSAMADPVPSLPTIDSSTATPTSTATAAVSKDPEDKKDEKSEKKHFKKGRGPSENASPVAIKAYERHHGLEHDASAPITVSTHAHPTAMVGPSVNASPKAGMAFRKHHH